MSAFFQFLMLLLETLKLHILLHYISIGHHWCRLFCACFWLGIWSVSVNIHVYLKRPLDCVDGYSALYMLFRVSLLIALFICLFLTALFSSSTIRLWISKASYQMSTLINFLQFYLFVLYIFQSYIASCICYILSGKFTLHSTKSKYWVQCDKTTSALFRVIHNMTSVDAPQVTTPPSHDLRLLSLWRVQDPAFLSTFLL